jgi:fatty acid desaturase
VGPGVVLGLAFQDPLILSQHTHIPMPTAGEAPVRPRLGTEQTEYTRSVDFPGWIGLGLLCGTGEHERHHAYPQVPGYRLHQVPWVPPRRVSAWRFLRGAKRLSGERFLFENSNTTEFQL